MLHSMQGKMDVNTFTDKLAAQVQDLPNTLSSLLDTASKQVEQAQSSVKESASGSKADSSKKE